MTQSTQAVRVAHAMALLVESIGGHHGRLRLSSMRGSGNRAPWMVTEVFADLFWEGLAFVF
jgi:hypothetical protein